MTDRDVVWAPQPGPQHSFIKCNVPEIFWGGARGGGKTDAVLGKWCNKAIRYGPGFNGIFFRKTMPSADDVWERAIYLATRTGATANITTSTLKWPSGARLRFRPLERVTDADKYQGQNISDVCIEEAGLYSDSRAIDRLHGVLRSVHGAPTQMVLTANPGGSGHNWIKTRYVDPAPAGNKILHRVLPNGKKHSYVFIPSRVQDNKILLEADPDYISRLHMVGSEQLVKAWLEGDWNAIEGAFFSEFDTARHVCEPFEIPDHWLKFRSMDWGSAKPFSVGWWAVVSDDMQWGGRTLPRGCLVRYREWYGAQRDKDGIVQPNKGLKMTAGEVGRGISEREEGDGVEFGVLDPAAFSEDGGPSIAERLALKKALFRKADNKRVAKAGAMGGWDMLRERLKGEADDRPMIVFFNTCTEIIRTLPVLQHDALRAEDLDTDSEDHAADEVRYACMARPWVRAKPEPIDEAIKTAPLYIRDFEPKPSGRLRPGI